MSPGCLYECTLTFLEGSRLEWVWPLDLSGLTAGTWSRCLSPRVSRCRSESSSVLEKAFRPKKRVVSSVPSERDVACVSRMSCLEKKGCGLGFMHLGEGVWLVSWTKEDVAWIFMRLEKGCGQVSRKSGVTWVSRGKGVWPMCHWRTNGAWLLDIHSLSRSLRNSTPTARKGKTHPRWWHVFNW